MLPYRIHTYPSARRRWIPLAGVAALLVVLGVFTLFFTLRGHRPAPPSPSATVVPAAAQQEQPQTGRQPGDTAPSANAPSDTQSTHAPLPSTDVPSRKVQTVILDAGHGGKDPGCMHGDYLEKDIALDIALKTRDLLEKKGIRVRMTRADDTFIPLPDRVVIANETPNAILVSIHVNSYEDSAVHGLETYCNTQTPGSEALAQMLFDSVRGNTGANARMVHTDSKFKVVYLTHIPACLVETGYFTNAAERRKLLDAQYREKIAQGIVNGIEKYQNS